VDINYYAVALAALVQVILRAIWYSPTLFGGPWMRAAGGRRDDLMGGGRGFVVSAVSALVTSYILARVVDWAEADSFVDGLRVGLLIWLGFVATALAVMTYFGGRPRMLWYVNAGYQVVALLLMGGLLAWWD
jgi:hypothetical protein